jgi:hypothetical protein
MEMGISHMIDWPEVLIGIALMLLMSVIFLVIGWVTVEDIKERSKNNGNSHKDVGNPESSDKRWFS